MENLDIPAPIAVSINSFEASFRIQNSFTNFLRNSYRLFCKDSLRNFVKYCSWKHCIRFIRNLSEDFFLNFSPNSFGNTSKISSSINIYQNCSMIFFLKICKDSFGASSVVFSRKYLERLLENFIQLFHGFLRNFSRHLIVNFRICIFKNFQRNFGRSSSRSSDSSIVSFRCFSGNSSGVFSDFFSDSTRNFLGDSLRSFFKFCFRKSWISSEKKTEFSDFLQRFLKNVFYGLFWKSLQKILLSFFQKSL